MKVLFVSSVERWLSSMKAENGLTRAMQVQMEEKSILFSEFLYLQHHDTKEILGKH